MYVVKNKISILLSSLLFLAHTPVYAETNTLTLTITEKTFQLVSDPADYASLVYGLVIVNEKLNTHHNYEQKLAALTFTPAFYHDYKIISKKDSHSKEAGCINDFAIFTSSQELTHSIWVGKTTLNDKKTEASVALHLGVKDSALNASSTPDIILQLVNTTNGWKIDDIQYQNTHTTLHSLIKTCIQNTHT